MEVVPGDDGTDDKVTTPGDDDVLGEFSDAVSSVGLGHKG